MEVKFNIKTIEKEIELTSKQAIELLRKIVKNDLETHYIAHIDNLSPLGSTLVRMTENEKETIRKQLDSEFTKIYNMINKLKNKPKLPEPKLIDPKYRQPHWQQKRQKILLAIATLDKDFTISDISNKLQISYTTVSTVLKSLRQEGKIKYHTEKRKIIHHKIEKEDIIPKISIISKEDREKKDKDLSSLIEDRDKKRNSIKGD
jgi:DNA-binding transcriptional regulator YhcF (GntR family)